MEHISCNLCGETQDTQLYQTKDYRVVLCLNCSLSYLNPRMTAQEYEQHYRSQYQIARHQISEKEAAIERLLKKKAYEQKKQRVSFFEGVVTPDSKVLEVGAGWGTFLKVFQDTFHCSVEGIEISALAAEVAREYYGLSIVEKPFEVYVQENSDQKQFDLILIHHVLEHFLDPSKVLKNLHGLLSPNGSVYIAVPNVANPDELLPQFFRIEHTYYFTPRTLIKMIEKNGFEVAKLVVGENDIKIIIKKGNKIYDGAEIEITAAQIQRTLRLRKYTEAVKNIIRPLYYKIKNTIHH